MIISRTTFTWLKNEAYGGMYNKYNALLAADEFNKPLEALEIAQQEAKQRATPQSYDLLAWSYYAKGDLKKALDIIENEVANKTFEPEVLYHMAEIYKSNGMMSQVLKLKADLLMSGYELGPLLTQKIKLL